MMTKCGTNATLMRWRDYASSVQGGRTRENTFSLGGFIH